MSNPRIRAGFEVALSSWALAQAPPIPIAYENKTFEPPATARYIRAFLLPGQTSSGDMDGDHRAYVGVFQASLYMPVGVGAGAAETLAESICNLFPKQTAIVSSGLTIWLTRPMSIGPSIPGITHYMVPISCSYRADT